MHTIKYKYMHAYICIYHLILTSRMWHKVNFKQSLTDLNSVFTFP